MSVPASPVEPGVVEPPEASDGEAARAAQVGRWGQVFALPNVAVHAHLLPDSTILLWGRRDRPDGTLDDHFCTPQIWDPATGQSRPTPQPTLPDGASTVNLFCSGHTLLPDGRLFVAGGHLQDTKGVNQVCTYDHDTNTWTALPPMNQGRWYPTATTLADGRVVVLSGSGEVPGKGVVITNVPQLWDGSGWQRAATYPGPPPLYPRLHVLADGRLFAAGTNAVTPVLDVTTNLWSDGMARTTGERQYAPSVLYDTDKVIYIGGGNDPGTDTPTARTDLADLAATPPTWRPAAAMAFPRRQHNATLLPDGTVLVTGGTGGPGFNDLSPGQPVHVAEFWDPTTDIWTQMAAESVDRCYHSTAVLLPDGRVLSAGGGEFAGQTNPADSHRDGQFFHPPYLFKGPRPQIDALSSTEVSNGEPITATVSGPAAAKVTLVRLSSVTHAFNVTQRINVLPFVRHGSTVTATVGPEPAACPPGHYMLFVLTAAGVPSIGRIVRVLPPRMAPVRAEVALDVGVASARAGGGDAAAETSTTAAAASEMTTEELDNAVVQRAREGNLGTEVIVGLTAQCPYGLGGCWAGAYEALATLDGVAAVRPIANATDSTATVYLRHHGLPNIDQWPSQLARSANASYHYRGVEVTLVGRLTRHADDLRLEVLDSGVVVDLAPLESGDELAWDLVGQRPTPATDEELSSFGRLAAHDGTAVRITGPLRNIQGRPTVLVRSFTRSSPDDAAPMPGQAPHPSPAASATSTTETS